MILEDYHYKSRDFFTSFLKKILKIAVDDDFLNFNIDLNNIPKPNVFSLRNLIEI